MKANQSALRVLADEGVSMTEEQLLQATRKPPSESTFGAVGVAEPPRVQERPLIPSTTTNAPAALVERKPTEKPIAIAIPVPDTSDQSPPRRLVRGVARACAATVYYVFAALREVYWALDRDAKCRSQGVQTVGRVLRTRTEEHEDPESGTYYTHYVSYEYDAGGRSHSVEKKVNRLGSLKKGVPISVYYLAETNRIYSALDRQPRVLVSKE